VLATRLDDVADEREDSGVKLVEAVGDVIETCREHDVATSICGQAGSKPEMVRFLVNEGATSISANIDAVRDVQHEVKRVEQKLILDSVR
jgi:pyruvate,water dikinase